MSPLRIFLLAAAALLLPLGGAWLLKVPAVPLPVLTALAFGLAALAAMAYQRAIVRPLRALREGTQEVAAGAFNPLPLRSLPGGWGETVAAFNGMVVSLQSRDEQLQALNDELTRRLRELDALNADQERRARQLTQLNNLTRRFTALLDVDALLYEVVVNIQETFGYGLVAVGLNEADWLVLRQSSDPRLMARTLVPLGLGIAGQVAATGGMILANDARANPHYVPIIPEVQAELALPILGKDGVLGVLDVLDNRRGAFQASDAAMLQSLAVQLGIAIENARLFHDAQQRAAQLGKILALLEQVHQQRDLPDVLQQITRAAQETLGWRTAALFLRDPRGARVTAAAASDDPATRAALLAMRPEATLEPSWKQERYRVSQSYFIRAEEATAELTDEPSILTPDDQPARPWEWQETDMLCVPITGPEGMLGHLAVDAPHDRRRPTLEQIQLLEVFAHQAANAIEDARLFDELQGKTAALEAANRDLSRASQLKSEFLASMSHELRTPLNAILGFSEILIDQGFGALNERQTRYLSNIHRSGQHLLDLINDVLDLSKIEAGRMELMPELFRLSSALHEVVTIIEPLAVQKGLTVAVEAAPDLERVVADRLRFKQVLYNLISNAVKFTPEGGHIRIRAWREPVNGSEAPQLMLEVTDTGIGIPEAELEQVFDIFYRLDRSFHRETEGTGLGLALVRRFVELHGGQVHATSRLGEGSTFTVALPQEVSSLS